MTEMLRRSAAPVAWWAAAFLLLPLQVDSGELRLVFRFGGLGGEMRSLGVELAALSEMPFVFGVRRWTRDVSHHGGLSGWAECSRREHWRRRTSIQQFPGI